MITGLAIGMQSVVIPLLTICVIIGVSTALVGLYGVGIHRRLRPGRRQRRRHRRDGRPG
jgi:hypothetical protein